MIIGIGLVTYSLIATEPTIQPTVSVFRTPGTKSVFPSTFAKI